MTKNVYDTFQKDADRYTPDRNAAYMERHSDYGGTRPMNSLSDNIKLYIAIRKSYESATEYKKLVIMTPSKIRIENSGFTIL